MNKLNDFNVENESENKGKIKKSNSRIKVTGLLVTIAFISSFLGAVFGFMAGGISDSIFSGNGAGLSVQERTEQRVIQEESAVIDVVEKTSPSVVSVVISKDVPRFRGSFYDYFFGQNTETERQRIGGGSGFFVDSSGYIVTNKHVINDTEAEYTVITNDGQEHNVEILASHPSMDIAILKIEGNDFPVIELGDSENLKAGQSVIAIGNSLGEFTNSVSFGIVSGLQRDITAGSSTGSAERLTNIIQTDAAINPGNSGGPLLNISGQVIGVNVAVAQGAENVGFALPINQVKETIAQVKSEGKITVPFLGVRYVILNDSIKQQNNLPFDYGALVLRGENRTDFAVIPGSPADKAGISENSIILEVNGEKITDQNQLSDLISKYKVGDEVTLKIWSKGETREIKIKLEERK